MPPRKKLYSAVLTSPRLARKCSFSHVAASQDARGLPVTCAAEEANLKPRISEPSVSGMPLAAYKSRRFAGEPCAWLRVVAPLLSAHWRDGTVNSSWSKSEMVWQ